MRRPSAAERDFHSGQLAAPMLTGARGDMAAETPPLVFLNSEEGLRAVSKIRYGWYLLTPGGNGTFSAKHSMMGALGSFASQALAEAACRAIDADRSRHPGSLRRSLIQDQG
jgi:hypothetical protein